ncbi:kinase-like protein [Xylona heveae TC161]|uniref:Kinase-like protein n=1 Tax=Xylona heveae (strain CBS 132557 / TC161) TaxID=1328760 RepID=A0A165ADX1_XYLHT|nr:kinase-like protein [Xylona heveae TC161]KZF20317.1 kinase-like protein [Xylona heveae TC161]
MSTPPPTKSTRKRITPFPGLVPIACNFDGTGGNILGAAFCYVLGLHPKVAFKFAFKYDYPEDYDPRWKQIYQTNTLHAEEGLAREKNVYMDIAKASRWHPNLHILQPCLCVPEGIFMPPMKCNLRKRLLAARGEKDEYFPPIKLENQPPITSDKKARWVKQLIGALAWLESIGYAHGDLRPPNILLNHDDNVVLADFGSSARLGEDRITSADTYCPLNFDYASHISEQYAAGWCIYTICQGQEPEEFNLPREWRGEDIKMEQISFPSTENLQFQDIIRKCWHLQYPSIAALARDVTTEYNMRKWWYSRWWEYVQERLYILAFLLERPWQLYLMRRVYKNLQAGSDP